VEKNDSAAALSVRPDPPHRLPDAEFVLTQQREAARGVGRAAVGVEDHRLDLGASAAARGSDLDPVTDQLRVRVLGGRARQQSPGEQIQHGGHVQLAFIGGDLRDIPALRRDRPVVTALTTRVAVQRSAPIFHSLSIHPPHALAQRDRPVSLTNGPRGQISQRGRRCGSAGFSQTDG